MTELIGKIKGAVFRDESDCNENETREENGEFAHEAFFSELLDKEKISFFDKYNDPSKRCHGTQLSDYYMIKAIGQGAFGKVYVAQMIETKITVAIKVMNKGKIIKTKQLDHVLNERNVLSAAKWPFLITMVDSFKDTRFVFIVLEYIEGGDMFSQVKRYGRFTETLTRFYAGQIVLAFEYLHKMSLIYRDLKPENILVRGDGYIKVTDFGFVKLVEGRTYTMCGTPEYLAPEIIKNKGYGLAVDWWTLGILIYEMLTGRSPFYRQNQMEMYEKILTGKYSTPSTLNAKSKSLLENLIQVNPIERFGNLRRGALDIKTHPWFQQLNWIKLYNREIRAQSKPPSKTFPNVSGNLLSIAAYADKQDLYEQEFKDF